MLLEQSFLKNHYNKLQILAEKIVKEILSPPKVKLKPNAKKKRKNKDKRVKLIEIEPVNAPKYETSAETIEESISKSVECNKRSNTTSDAIHELSLLINPLQSVISKPDFQVEIEDYSSFDTKNLIFDVLSDSSTQADIEFEKDIFDSLIFDETILGARSCRLRKIYAAKSIVWDEEMKKIRKDALQETAIMNDPYSFNDFSVVKDYYHYHTNPYINWCGKLYNLNNLR